MEFGINQKMPKQLKSVKQASIGVCMIFFFVSTDHFCHILALEFSFLCRVNCLQVSETGYLQPTCLYQSFQAVSRLQSMAQNASLR